VLGTRGIPNVQGGVETHIEKLAPKLAALDPQTDLVVLARRSHVLAGRYGYRGVEVIALPAPRNRYLEAFTHTLLGVLYARFALRARLVHLHAIGPSLLAPLAKLLGMKVVVTHHSRNYLHAKWNTLARRGLRLGEACAAMFADRIIAVSPSLAAELRVRYPTKAHKISYIPNGAPSFERECDAATDVAVLERVGAKPANYILAVGRLVPEKAFHDLIAAVQTGRVAQALVIAGGADHADDYSRELLASASDKVIFAGYVRHAELFALYRNASLFVLPSYQEGMPISVLEAVAAETPILMSDIPANTDLGLPEKHYFPVGDVAALTEKLQTPHADLRTDGAAFLAQFDWDDIARKTLAVYAEALGAD
jgi:glycosyltransferase involved in cell wall biosynthesis